MRWCSLIIKFWTLRTSLEVVVGSSRGIFSGGGEGFLVCRGLASLSESSLGRFKGSKGFDNSWLSDGGVAGGVGLFFSSNVLAASGVRGGVGLFFARGLSSSSLARFNVSLSSAAFTASPFSGPRLVPRSAILRLRFLSGSPLSDPDRGDALLACELFILYSSDTLAESKSAGDAGAVGTSSEIAIGVAESKEMASASSVLFFSAEEATAETMFLWRQFISSTPWLIWRTLTSCGGEGRELEGEGVRDREMPSSSSVDSSRILFFFFGDL